MRNSEASGGRIGFCIPSNISLRDRESVALYF